MPESPWFLPGSCLGLFCLGVSAGSATWQKVTLGDCDNRFFFHFSHKIRCLLEFYTSLYFGNLWLVTLRWFHPDLRHLLRQFRQTGATLSVTNTGRSSGSRDYRNLDYFLNYFKLFFFSWTCCYNESYGNFRGHLCGGSLQSWVDSPGFNRTSYAEVPQDFGAGKRRLCATSRYSPWIQNQRDTTFHSSHSSHFVRGSAHNLGWGVGHVTRLIYRLWRLHYRS